MAGKTPTDAEVIAALRAAGAKGFQPHKRCGEELRQFDLDITTVCEWVAECELSELEQSEPDDDPKRSNCWIAVLKIDVEDDPWAPYYMKIVLMLPDLDGAYLLSIHKWT